MEKDQIPTHEVLLIGLDHNKHDVPYIVVGRKNARGVLDVLNMFEGDEAIELYKKLTTRKEENS